MTISGVDQVGERQIGAKTRVFGVIGNPVAHSMSPLMHNRAMALTGFNGIYVAFRAPDISAAISGLRALGIRGASITIPHKQAVIPLLDEIDDEARRIGAVNTIAVDPEGRLLGANTDGRGALAALEAHIRVAGKAVLLVGAGGAASAIGASIVAAGARLTLLNRSDNTGRALARRLGCDFVPLSQAHKADGEILINTTPVGMWPGVDRMPIPRTMLQPGMVVMDIVYNPLRTRLLQTARSQGCTVLDGLGMFVRQGALQFEMWTGRPAPVEQMRLAVAAALESDPPGEATR
jgi:shikimate dehydrogenase